MAIGWNLGNTLDATSWNTNAGLGTETDWGMPKTTQAMIKAVREAGFKTIRIPVSWHNHISNAETITIDSAWMARVKTIVDWAIDEGMCVIINIHHDNMKISEMNKNLGFALSPDEAIQAKSKDYIAAIWTQISGTFADYDNNLVFEVLNEPRDVDGEWKGNEWWCNNSEVLNCITAYEQVALDVIRKSGGKNATRFVMVPGYAASGSDSSLLNAYTMPKDTAEDRLILSAHAYSPYNFAMNDMADTTFDSADANTLTGLFNYLNTSYIKKGIGVVMGEASASDKGNTAERIKWTKDYFTKATKIGIPVVLWDNMVLYANSNDPAESHGYLDRRKCIWYFPSIIKTMMKAVYGDSIVIEDEDPNSNPPEDNDTDTTDGVEILSEPLILSDEEWGINKTISAANFASATSSSKLLFVYESLNRDYMNIKLQEGDWGAVICNGEIENAVLGNNVIVPSSASGTLVYTPTTEEWNSIKSKGIVVYGFGVKITKIILK